MHHFDLRHDKRLCVRVPTDQLELKPDLRWRPVHLVARGHSTSRLRLRHESQPLLQTWQFNLRRAKILDP